MAEERILLRIQKYALDSGMTYKTLESKLAELIKDIPTELDELEENKQVLLDKGVRAFIWVLLREVLFEHEWLEMFEVGPLEEDFLERIYPDYVTHQGTFLNLITHLQGIEGIRLSSEFLQYPWMDQIKRSYDPERGVRLALTLLFTLGVTNEQIAEKLEEILQENDAKRPPSGSSTQV